MFLLPLAGFVEVLAPHSSADLVRMLFMWETITSEGRLIPSVLMKHFRWSWVRFWYVSFLSFPPVQSWVGLVLGSNSIIGANVYW